MSVSRIIAHLYFIFILMFLSCCTISQQGTLSAKELDFYKIVGLNLRDDINQSIKINIFPSSNTDLKENMDIDFEISINAKVLPLQRPLDALSFYYLNDNTNEWQKVDDIANNMYSGNGLIEDILPNVKIYTLSDGGNPDISDISTNPVLLRVFWFAYLVRDNVQSNQKVAAFLDIEIQP